MGLFSRNASKKKNSESQRERKVKRKERRKKQKENKQYPTNREPEIRERMDKETEKENPDLKKSSRQFKKKRRTKVKKKLELHQTSLDQIKPVGNIKVSSTFIQIGGRYARIMSFVVAPGRFNQLRPMWGIDTIPKIVSNKDLKKMDVDAKIIHSFNIRPKKWVEKKIPDAMEVATTGFRETANSSQAMDADEYKDTHSETRQIASEIRSGASYLDLSIRVIVTAPSEEYLNDAVRILERDYRSTFQQDVDLVPYVSQQGEEYAGMLNSAEDQLGENYQLTSHEFAGAYPFITSGINDDTGTYVGALAYEVNSNPVLLDLMDFDQLAVVCARGRAEDLKSRNFKDVNYDFQATTAWGVEIAQSALIHGQRVVHLVLNGEDLRKVGSDLRSETAYVDLTHERSGINTMEPFSVGMDEMSAMSVLLEKIATMVKQFSRRTNDLDDSQLKSSDITNLKALLREFYIEEGMWQGDAKNNKELLRLLNLPAKEYPKINKFVVFLRDHLTDAQKAANRGEGSGDVESIKKLYNIIKSMSDNYSDLFDRRTTINRSLIQQSAQTVFDFGVLYKRSEEALMAHFVNAFSYAERELHENDVLVIHGMDKTSESVNEFLNQRLNQMFDRGVKTVLMYQHPDIMLSKKRRHEQHRKWFEYAEYRLTNTMGASAMDRYAEILRVSLPTTVQQAMQGSDYQIYLINRQTRNHNDRIIFNYHMSL